MKDLLNQIRTANQPGLFYVALFSALAIPDICGALESQNGEATPEKYIAWFDRYVAPRYQVGGRTNLTGEDAYFFRCSMLHQGRTHHPGSGISRILFVEPEATTNVFHNNVMNDALNIDVQIFINDIVDAAETWLTTAEETPEFKANLARFVTRYPNGLAPYIVGVPIIT